MRSNYTELAPITAILNHREERSGTAVEAALIWRDGVRSSKSYTVTAAAGVAVEFDSNFPVRPHSVQLRPELDLEGAAHAELRTLFGSTFTEAVSQTAQLGICTVPLTLDSCNRFELAQLQQNSPATPLLIAEACGRILASYAQTIPVQHTQCQSCQ